jgi:hypothetical protein
MLWLNIPSACQFASMKISLLVNYIVFDDRLEWKADAVQMLITISSMNSNVSMFPLPHHISVCQRHFTLKNKLYLFCVYTHKIYSIKEISS